MSIQITASITQGYTTDNMPWEYDSFRHDTMATPM